MVDSRRNVVAFYVRLSTDTDSPLQPVYRAKYGVLSGGNIVLAGCPQGAVKCKIEKIEETRFSFHPMGQHRKKAGGRSREAGVYMFQWERTESVRTSAARKVLFI